MAADKKKTPSGAAPGTDEEAILKNLNISPADGLGETAFGPGRPLPKKVELDIDDLALEEEEEEPKPVEKPGPAPPAPKPPAPPPARKVEKPKEEVKPRKLSLAKIILIASVPLVFLTPAIWYLGSKQILKPPVKRVVLQPGEIELKPFIINFPESRPEKMAILTLRIMFPDYQVRREFEGQLLAYRDVIYRYVQSRGPDILTDSKAKDQLAKQLTKLVNSLLKQGEIRMIEIYDLKEG